MSKSITIQNEQLCDTNMISSPKKGSHCGFIVELGRCFPQSKGMFNRWTGLDVLGKPDIDFIKSIFPGATFKFTKSRHWMRLTNFDEFKATYKKHFNF